MKNFSERYRYLNPQQRKAVDALDGPVMVVAGPGTGKTELLSVRAANILAKADVGPSNILCLTYTESGATAMRERLSQLIGPEAYKIAVHTFHSFGTEIINRYSQYFYSGANFRPADELSTYEVMANIFAALPISSPLAGTMNGTYTHLRDTQAVISDLKKSGLTPDELLATLDKNDAFTDWIQPRIASVFGPRLSKTRFTDIRSLLTEAGLYDESPLDLITYVPLVHVFTDTLERALTDAESSDSTRPVSEWKRRWITKDHDGNLILKDAARSHKLRATADIYRHYLAAMQERSLYDFDDMILRVVHALEMIPDLKYELQEQYQYIMVDEFQDTNDAQMRVIWNLTNAPELEGRPNLLVVGDDDQAIYRFQGATLSNILDFTDHYRDVEVIALTDNYRSDENILQLARHLITQGEERLENRLPGLNKSLTPHYKPAQSKLEYHQFATSGDENYAIADMIMQSLQQQPAKSRAIIARRHQQLQAILPFLQERDIPLIYDKEENIFEQESIIALEKLAVIVTYLGKNRNEEAEALLPELLAHPAWGVDTADLWDLSLRARETKKGWIDTMRARSDRLHDIAEWLIESGRQALHRPLEPMLDWLLGSHVDIPVGDTSDDEPFPNDSTASQPVSAFTSPLREYFFPADQLQSHPAAYLHHLSALKTLRSSLREYRPDEVLSLADFVSFCELHRTLNLGIRTNEKSGSEEGAVHLLSAHSAKGLEFDEVYVIGLSDRTWGETARKRTRLIAFPHNLPLGFDADTHDERLRLLYVALTRAKSELLLSTHLRTDTGSTTLPIGYLEGGAVTPDKHEERPSPTELVHQQETDWRSSYASIPPASMERLLAPILERYKLSATHLANYLDVSRAGPEQFLLHNLLRFPQAMNASSAYGSAIHSALQRAHTQFAATGTRPPAEEIILHFREELQRYPLEQTDIAKKLAQGDESLSIFLSEMYDTFRPDQRAEVDFSTEDIRVGDARLTGKIDLMTINENDKTITVTDYKTGKAVPRWSGRTDWERIKLHHYRQQLMFYKLLVEHSRSFDGYSVSKGTIQFVEPDRQGRIMQLDHEFDPQEMREFESLVCAVWQRIQAREFIAITDYEPTMSGVRSFEDSLLAGN